MNTSGEQRALPGAPAGVPDAYDEHVKLMMDLQVLAFQSDLTRVFAFKLSRDVSNRVYPETGVTTGFHIASHHGEREDRITDLAKINRYHVGLVPYLLEKLKNAPDGDSGTLLDNSLIFYGSPMGNPNVHNHKRCPLFIAGHAGGAIKGNTAHPRRRRHADGQRDAEHAADLRRRRPAVRRQQGRDGPQRRGRHDRGKALTAMTARPRSPPRRPRRRRRRARRRCCRRRQPQRRWPTRPWPGTPPRCASCSRAAPTPTPRRATA